jgi:hypothetical protein
MIYETIMDQIFDSTVRDVPRPERWTRKHSYTLFNAECDVTTAMGRTSWLAKMMSFCRNIAEAFPDGMPENCIFYSEFVGEGPDRV